MHERFVKLATRLISLHGRTAKLLAAVTHDAGNVDPDITWEEVGNLTVVQTSFSADNANSFQEVEVGDVFFIASAENSVKPTTENRIRTLGLDYTVIDVQVVQPGNTEILYKIHARV